MALDIIETNLFKEPKEIIKKSIPRYRCNLTFKSNAFDFINLPKILRSKEVCDNLPSNLDVFDIPMVVYILILSIASTLFNYKQFVLYLILPYLVGSLWVKPADYKSSPLFSVFS